MDWSSVSYFIPQEFASPDAPDSYAKISPKLVYLLEAVRNYIGRPMHINSAYRTPAHNRKVGGATHSQHVLGTAADISTRGWTQEQRREFVRIVRGLGFGGIGIYPTFIHVDVRANKVAWRKFGKAYEAVPVGREGEYV